MEHTRNSITLRGNLQALPCLSHENHGKQFYKFFLEVPRLSGAIDTLPVIAESQLLNEMDLSAGEQICVTGQVRSHNIRENGIRRLLIFVYACSVMADNGLPVNDVFLCGPICKEPTYRRTPLGREICDAMLAVPRAFQRADYLPCILWGRTAQQVSQCHVRSEITVHGRLQSRCYTKLTDDGPVERVTYEISALTAEIIDSNG